MLKIVFNDGTVTQAGFMAVKSGVIELQGENVENITGFKAYTEKNMLLGDYSTYTTKYNQYTVIVNGIQLSTGEVEPEPPIPPTPPTPKTTATVLFVAGEGATLSGTTKKTVNIGTDASTLKLPTVTVTDNTKEFAGWNPEVTGLINNDITYTATCKTKYEFTLEGKVENLKNTNNDLIETSAQLLYEVSLHELSYLV